MSTADPINSLLGPACPACGKAKKPRSSFCGACYFSLPPEVRRGLFRLVGHGYEESFTEAMKILLEHRPTQDAPPAPAASPRTPSPPSLFGDLTP